MSMKHWLAALLLWPALTVAATARRAIAEGAFGRWASQPVP